MFSPLLVPALGLGFGVSFPPKKGSVKPGNPDANPFVIWGFPEKWW